MIGNEDVIYFLLTDRFRRGEASTAGPGAEPQPTNSRGWHGGDFDGLVESLPYLKHLGVTALWITPVYLSTGKVGDSHGYHGYWALDFEKVDPHLYQADPERTEGAKSYLKDLVDRCHDAGLKVILDMVVNHTGYGYRGSGYPDKRFEPHHFNKHDASSEVEGELAGLPDLDHDQPFVADYFVQNVLAWIDETGIDGIRMDTAKHVEPVFWYYYKSAIRTACPQVTLIGEVLCEEPRDVPALADFQRRHDFDAVFDFPLRKKLIEVFVHDAPLTWLARPRLSDHEPYGILDRDGDYTNPFRLVTLLDNHDMSTRIYTTILDRVGDWDRLLAQRLMKLAASFLFTTRGIPQLYCGNEVAMEGRGDPDNRADFPWHILDDSLEPADGHGDAQAVYGHVRRLIELRREHRALSCGYLLTLWVDTFAYVYLRAAGDDVVVIAVNNGRQDMPVPLAVPFAANANLPPRLVGLIGAATFADAVDPAYTTKPADGRLPISVPGKAARILVPA